MTVPPAPWIELKEVAEQFAQAFTDSIAAETGSRVELGNAASFIPEEMVGSRPAPIRAYVVNFAEPLRDALIVVTSLGPEHVEPLLGPATRALLESAALVEGADDMYYVESVVQYDEVANAVDQADALFLEASYAVDLPLGGLHVVFGTGLLESAACYMSGQADPWANGFPAEGAEVDDAPLEVAAEADEPSESALDALDRELAEQEAAAATATPTPIGVAGGAEPLDFNSVAAAAAAAPAPPVSDTKRWASLLSGVEVEVSAELGRTNLELGDITTLVADRVLTLDQQVDQPVTVFVNGTAFATARLVIVDGEYGIEILEVLEQVELPGSAATYSFAA